ncbi:SagB family peptide dehydrogenase [Paenibacillus contaminans]|uniref:NADH oxidase n=1 Tax=Paenibacillus contaminans TaxID=450362 RepID=A0A329MTJ9_9BACL|nr:SagB family peptide dehydrogenase [Paenibacillus contaminans]RAV22870.1 NADH oxidase [Paenibacillus contaminans]
MSLEKFLYNLHFDVAKTKPPDLAVDWEDSPLPYKLYRGLPEMPLSPDVPLSLDGTAHESGKTGLREIGHFLWYAFGLSQLSQSVVGYSDGDAGLMQMYRRFAPSGGALYPNEIYMYLKAAELPEGIYHYNAAHHRLVLLREGAFDAYLTSALGGRCKVSDCFGLVFVSTMFWKNFFKYNHFAYRLQGLDAGALLGQMLETAKRFGFETGVMYRFLDRPINHLIGLSEREECVYAVVPLSTKPWADLINDDGSHVEPARVSELCSELPALYRRQYVRSVKVGVSPLLTRMNEAAILDSMGTPPASIDGQTRFIRQYGETPLPSAERLHYDLASVSRRRYSPNGDFVLSKVSREQLALLLRETITSYSYANDLDKRDRDHPHLNRVSLFCCTHNVDGLPDGAYGYDGVAHSLLLMRQGDHRLKLQLGMTADNVNLLQVPLCFHVAGDRGHLRRSLGFRGYRIQQMEAGMLLQRLLLTASAIGMAGHPLLGYDAMLSDEIYRMPTQGITGLIQVPVGAYRQGPRLTGGLHA